MANEGADLPTLYIETSVVSYLAGRPSRDILVLAHQEVTRQWWEDRLRKFQAFVSPLVLRNRREAIPKPLGGGWTLFGA